MKIKSYLLLFVNLFLISVIIIKLIKRRRENNTNNLKNQLLSNTQRSKITKSILGIKWKDVVKPLSNFKLEKEPKPRSLEREAMRLKRKWAEHKSRLKGERWTPRSRHLQRKKSEDMELRKCFHQRCRRSTENTEYYCEWRMMIKTVVIIIDDYNKRKI